MKTCKKITLSILIMFNVSIIYGQTFSSSDTFSNKFSIKKFETESHIIKFKTEKLVDKLEIEGQILDKETMQGVPGVTILESGSNNGALTDFDGKFKLKTFNKKPILNIQFIGFNTEKININDVEDVNNSITSLAGLLVADFGEESVIQPNLMLSQGWKLGRHAVELRVLGFQKNKDTIQQVNGLNLIKPEISKYNFRLTGDIIPFEKMRKFSIIPEINVFKQQLNKPKSETQVIQNYDITSLLGKLTAGYSAADGLHFYASGVYYNVFEGVQFYEERFGETAVKQFWNFELSGKFAFGKGALDGTFIQAVFNLNSTDYKELLNTKDSGVFLIRIGFDKPLIKS